MKHYTASIYLSCLVAHNQLSSATAFQSTFGSVSRKRSFSADRYVNIRTGSDRTFELNQASSNEDFTTTRRQRNQPSSLSAFTVDALDAQLDMAGSDLMRIPTQLVDFSGLQSVLTTALMVTGNTIGAGALVMPELAAKSGMAISTGIFVGAYVVNLISGLVLAEVAIKENESSGGDVATSFKEFADANLDSPSAASIVSGLSIFTNTCILVFGLNRAGDVGSSMLGGALDPTMCMFGFAAVLGALPITQSRENVSKISSMIVMALFASFFGLLVPGLANVQDPVGTFFSPGTCESGISETAPIILMSMVYQNIVPTVTKILDYDRDKSFAAIALGSFLPLCLYLAWSFACIGGGVDMNAVGASGALMTVFSVTATIGSSIGCAMAIPEEVGFFLPSNDKSNDEDNNGLANPVAVAVGVGIPAAIAYMFAGGDDLTMAFKIAGSYGTPLLYGVIPAAMAWTQRKRLEDIPNLVPGGVATLAGLGLASMCLVMQELSIDVGAFLS